jgi:uncharacterized protein
LTASTWFQIAAGFGTGLSGGALSGLFGVGGGIILVPLLHLLLGLDQHQAQGVTLASLLLPNSLPAMFHYRRSGVPIYWHLVWAMVLSFLPGVWLGASLANVIPERPLRQIFVGFLIILAIRTFLAKPVRPGAGLDEHSPEPPWWPGLFIGLLGGLLAGLLGIGGGVVMIPLLGLWLKLRQHQAQLISLAVLLPPIGLPGLFVYARHQADFPWFLLCGLAIGFMTGTYLGARMATDVSGPRLRKAFAGLMTATAVLMIWRH